MWSLGIDRYSLILFIQKQIYSDKIVLIECVMNWWHVIKMSFFSQVEECSDCEFDELIPEAKRVTLSLTLVSKTSTKYMYSVGHDLKWSGEGEDYRTIIFFLT